MTGLPALPGRGNCLEISSTWLSYPRSVLVVSFSSLSRQHSSIFNAADSQRLKRNILFGRCRKREHKILHCIQTSSDLSHHELSRHLISYAISNLLYMLLVYYFYLKKKTIFTWKIILIPLSEKYLFWKNLQFRHEYKKITFCVSICFIFIFKVNQALIRWQSIIEGNE